MSKHTEAALATMERKMLGLTLNRKKRAGESDAEFHHNLNIHINKLMGDFVFVSIVQHWKSSYVSWHGRVHRMHFAEPVRILSHLHSTQVYRNTPPAARPCRVRRGKPLEDAAESLVGLYGPFWHNLASDRAEWKAVKCNFLQKHGALREPVTPLWDSRFLRHITNKQRDVLDAKYMPLQLKTLFIVDRDLVASLVLGKWDTRRKLEWAPYVKKLRWGLYAMEFQWKGVPVSGKDSLLMHAKRKHNSMADCLCNIVLDRDWPFFEHFVDQCTVKPGDGSMIVVSSDGASRGNPGPASASACVQLYRNGSLEVVASRALRLGDRTCNFAEFEAACLAQTLFTEWCSRVGLVV
jgi:hypothetical protein